MIRTSLMVLAGILSGPAFGASLVMQDDFEKDLAENWKGIGTYWQSASIAASGERAVHRVLYPGTKPSEKPYLLTSARLFPVPQGKFGFSIQCSGGDQSGTPVRQALALEFYDAAGKRLPVPDDVREYPLETDRFGYRRTAAAIAAPTGAAQFRPVLRIYVSGPIEKTAFIRFDDLQIGDVEPVPVTPPKTNTIDLEAEKLDTTFDHQATGWKNIDGKIWRLSTVAKNGKYGVECLAPASLPNGHCETLESRVALPVTGGKPYRLSGYIRSTDKSLSTRLAVELLFRDAAGKELGRAGTRPEVPPVGRWVETSALIDVPVGAVSADVALQVVATRAVQEAFRSSFDAIELLPWQDAKKLADRTGTPPAPLQLDDPDSGKTTSGNLGIGKFYRADRAPQLEYADRYPGRWTLGSKLTDGLREKGVDFKKGSYVGWKGVEPVSVVVDLGRKQTLEEVLISGFEEDESHFLRPDAFRVSLRDTEDGEWRPWGEWRADAGAPRKNGAYELKLTAAPATGRYVRLTFTPDQSRKAGFLMLDEIQLDGKIKNTWKYVPSKGAYHGAFPPSYGFKEPLRGGRKLPMSLQTYEKLVGKKVAMVLWYQGMSPERSFSELQSLRLHDLAENHYGQRFMSLGWLPPASVSLEDILSGKLDDYFYEYFSDSIDEAKTLGDKTPIWFRPMNEFNAGWVNWGLDPDRFRPAWRRLYNIAEQVGAADRHVFVWSPNHRSYPDVPWNKMERYYPGDQYVDWVGLSCYAPSARYAENDAARYPFGRVKEVNEKYGSYKPMMIAEGGYDSPDKTDRVRWVREWFEFQKRFPNFKAMIWENHNTRVIQDDAAALELYRREVADPYWISETYLGEEVDK